VSSTRRTAITAGTLFLVATLSALAAAVLLPALTGTDYLAGVAAHSGQLDAAALLYLVAAGASVGIAIALYPLLKQTDDALALGSVVFRTIEAVFYIAGVVSLLTIATLAQQLTTAPPADAATYAMADTLVSIREHSAVAAVFAFSVGAFMYYLVFWRARLVPRWLSGWGLVAVPLMLTASVLALIGDNPVTGYVPLALPIGAQELVLAGWLLVAGFNPPAETHDRSDGRPGTLASGPDLAPSRASDGGYRDGGDVGSIG
jgi:hypothetical protein